MGLVKAPGRIDAGSIRFQGRELVGLPSAAYRRLRGRDIAMTMQDALTALNPAYTVGDQITEVLVAHGEALTGRSEDHTSELQSLMRISYAVFCLKKKTTHPH